MLTTTRFGAMAAGSSPRGLPKLGTPVTLTGMTFPFAYRFAQEAPSSSLRDLDDVVLTVAVMSDDGSTIPAGTEGTIVSVHGDGESYVVEFAEPLGALVTAEPHEVRAVEAPTA